MFLSLAGVCTRSIREIEHDRRSSTRDRTVSRHGRALQRAFAMMVSMSIVHVVHFVTATSATNKKVVRPEQPRVLLLPGVLTGYTGWWFRLVTGRRARDVIEWEVIRRGPMPRVFQQARAVARRAAAEHAADDGRNRLVTVVRRGIVGGGRVIAGLRRRRLLRVHRVRQRAGGRRWIEEIFVRFTALHAFGERGWMDGRRRRKIESR